MIVVESHLNRRSALSRLLIAVPLATWPTAVPAAVELGARVAATPSIELLEPIVEFALGVDAVQVACQDPTRWPALRLQLQRFYGGGPFSEQYFVFGLFDKYEKAIKYDDLPEFVEQDRRARRVACQETLAALEQIKRVLDGADGDSAGDTLDGLARRSQAAMQRWLARVPELDLRAATGLLAAHDAADLNADGLLSEVERSMMAPELASSWRKIDPDEVAELFRRTRLGPWSASDWRPAGGANLGRGLNGRAPAS